MQNPQALWRAPGTISKTDLTELSGHRHIAATQKELQKTDTHIFSINLSVNVPYPRGESRFRTKQPCVGRWVNAIEKDRYLQGLWCGFGVIDNSGGTPT